MMAILTPCLAMAALGFLYGAIHLLAGKKLREGNRSSDAGDCFSCGAGCAGCGRMGCEGIKPCRPDDSGQ